MMIRQKNSFHMQRQPLSGLINLIWAVETIGDNPSQAIVENLVIRTLGKTGEAMEIEPCAKLTTEDAQNLMDELWHVGIRPSEGSGSSGSLAATEKHLEDMREMAFHKIGGKKP